MDIIIDNYFDINCPICIYAWWTSITHSCLGSYDCNPNDPTKPHFLFHNGSLLVDESYCSDINSNSSIPSNILFVDADFISWYLYLGQGEIISDPEWSIERALAGFLHY